MPSSTGNVHLPFVDLIKLEQINQHTYRSIAQPFAPGGDHPRSHGVAYGGHVYAQAAWAAAQTVADGFILHHMSGYFLLGAVASTPFLYNVQKVRDGRSYCNRTITVSQENGACFIGICSFKAGEETNLDEYKRVNIWTEYEEVLKDKKPEDFEETPGLDLHWYWQWQKETGQNEKFPGLRAHKVDMQAYNERRQPLDRRQLSFYQTIGELTNNPNMHICAHLYASDRNSLCIVANHFDAGVHYSQMGSLAITVIFHSPIEQMLIGKSKEWYCKEDWTTRIGSGRGISNSYLWNSDGIHIATVMQEGLIRYGKKLTGKL